MEPTAGDPLEQEIIPDGPLSQMLFDIAMAASPVPSDLLIRGRADLYSPLHPEDTIADIVFDTPGGVVEVVFQFFAVDGMANEFIEFDLGSTGVRRVWPGVGEGHTKDAGEARSVTIYGDDGFMLSVQASRRSEDIGSPAPLTIEELQAWALAIAESITSQS